MNALLARAKQGFNALTLREQWLIALAGWFAILALGTLVFLQPMAKSLSELSRQVAQSEATARDLASLNVLKQQKLEVSPDLEQSRALASLQHALSSLNGEVNEKVAGLVSASQMPALMESVLAQSDRLTLLSMQSLPAQKLTAEKDSGFYIHPVEMTLKGRYFDIVDYLAALEALPVKYYWRGVDYHVTQYPWAQVTLRVYTLGESPVFIGGSHHAQP